MITMENWATKAISKLQLQHKNVTGRKEEAMASSVMSILKDFCTQDERFARAVVQGGHFADCMKAVAKGVGSSISDFDAYHKAVQFYFPSAKIEMQMRISTTGDDTLSKLSNTSSPLVLNLMEIL